MDGDFNYVFGLCVIKKCSFLFPLLNGGLWDVFDVEIYFKKNASFHFGTERFGIAMFNVDSTSSLRYRCQLELGYFVIAGFHTKYYNSIRIPTEQNRFAVQFTYAALLVKSSETVQVWLNLLCNRSLAPLFHCLYKRRHLRSEFQCHGTPLEHLSNRPGCTHQVQR